MILMIDIVLGSTDEQWKEGCGRPKARKLCSDSFTQLVRSSAPRGHRWSLSDLSVMEFSLDS